jgi:DNA-binding NarL/FixJ family response regulator
MTATKKSPTVPKGTKIHKAGVNYRDRNQIARMAEDGLSAKEISLRLGVYEQVVKNFMPKKKPAAKKPAAKKESVDDLTE